VAYQMAPLRMTFSDHEGQFCCLKPFYIAYIWKYRVVSVICLHMNWNARGL